MQNSEAPEQLHGEGKALIAQLSTEQLDELLYNTEVTCLFLRTKYWKYYALCNLPYSALKAHKSGRYEWTTVNERTNFENKVIRLRKEYLTTEREA